MAGWYTSSQYRVCMCSARELSVSFPALHQTIRFKCSWSNIVLPTTAVICFLVMGVYGLNIIGIMHVTDFPWSPFHSHILVCRSDALVGQSIQCNCNNLGWISIGSKRIQLILITVCGMNLHCDLLKIKSHGKVHNTRYTGLIRVPSGVKQMFYTFLFLGLQPPVDHGLVIHEVSRWHSATQYS